MKIGEIVSIIFLNSEVFFFAINYLFIILYYKKTPLERYLLFNGQFRGQFHLALRLRQNPNAVQALGAAKGGRPRWRAGCFFKTAKNLEKCRLELYFGQKQTFLTTDV